MEHSPNRCARFRFWWRTYLVERGSVLPCEICQRQCITVSKTRPSAITHHHYGVERANFASDDAACALQLQGDAASYCLWRQIFHAILVCLQAPCRTVEMSCQADNNRRSFDREARERVAEPRSSAFAQHVVTQARWNCYSYLSLPGFVLGCLLASNDAS